MASAEWFDIYDVRILRETAKAFLVEFWREVSEEHWILKSQLRNPRSWHRGDSGTMQVTLWFARQAGLVGDHQDSHDSNHSSSVPSLDLSKSKRVYLSLIARHHP